MSKSKKKKSPSHGSLPDGVNVAERDYRSARRERGHADSPSAPDGISGNF